ncbi:antibiotic biosynthesis monooxygenase family protein [Melissococcus plutonius]|uniref:antibiotic biosynthesis monooxygenase family protein n=1 Tax=Melissococcus plutonius TaxID=33970 RepID=UPI00065DE58C|nr:putative quinol monooxygenase [Melissococcus plutonius]AIM26062.1 putative monooxygenase YcnE [Melissococcus plutonius S1]KMT23580.1 putative monooxygenase YcnE [Melissococcus plutonius]KMT23632.1 putative monooxygenase YcnE [Melissococcus plutonius]KMT24267.1 putative monooxygenase YcnE [Melissococcus plutonius]KMT28094.1 putative monooxygenase YcnE [Melissococcus plutonius]
MSLTVMITYTGKEDHAKQFMEEMIEQGIVNKIRAQEGNERYEYYLPVEDQHSILLIDRWKDQSALDIHHQSDMMKQIAILRKKYQLSMKVETFATD